jgi:hypothetical protein
VDALKLRHQLSALPLPIRAISHVLTGLLRNLWAIFLVLVYKREKVCGDSQANENNGGNRKNYEGDRTEAEQRQRFNDQRTNQD